MSYFLYIAPFQYINEQTIERYWLNLLGENPEGCNHYYPINDIAAKNIFVLPVREQQSPLRPAKGGTGKTPPPVAGSDDNRPPPLATLCYDKIQG